MKTQLTPEVATQIVGKKIRWNAPASRYNDPYKGIAIINVVEKKDRRPIHATTIEGDDLNYAFNEWDESRHINRPLCYSDGDRYIEFEIIE